MSCASLPGAPVPEIRKIDARIVGVTFDEARMAFDIAVHNPYLVAIRTPRFRYDLEVAGSDFLSSTVSGSGRLPAGVTSVVTLPVRISYYDLFRSYPALREDAEIGYRLRVALGLSEMSAVEIPFYHEGTFPTLRPPHVTAAKIQLSEVSLSEAKLIVNADIENPNVFVVGVDDLSYELEISDITIGVYGVPLGKATIAPGQKARMVLTGDITSSEGLIELLIKGVPNIPNLSASGQLWTPYGTAMIAQ
jgi:LEA14-like dessication related protein